MNKSGDTRNSQETWKCYKPEYYYGSTQVSIVDHLRYKERYKETISCNNLGQYRCCLVNGTHNDVAPLQMWGCQFTEILPHMHLKLVQALGRIPWIRIISYMEIRTYFHVLCNYSQNYLLIRISPLPKNPNNTFSFPTVQLSAVTVYMDKPNTIDISRYS